MRSTIVNIFNNLKSTKNITMIINELNEHKNNLNKYTFMKQYINPLASTKVKYDIKEFNQIITTSFSTYHRSDSTRITLTDKHDGHQIGFIQYNPRSGQIGLLFINDKKYMRCGLGTQLLILGINHMKKHNTKEVWAVTKDNHPYWSNIMNFLPRDPAHSSVTGNGYYMSLSEK